MNFMNKIKTVLIIIIALIIIFNQVQLTLAATMLGEKNVFSSLYTNIVKYVKNSGSIGKLSGTGNNDLKDVDLSQIKSTAQGLAAIFPLDQIKTQEDATAMLMPHGMPDYGQTLGVSFDEPLKSLDTLAKAQKPLLAGLTPEQKTRFINLASMPLGISCEYCCGVGAVGIKPDGSSACGCQHNPALLSVTMWLMQNTDYSDAEILREVYRWKTMFFPKNMIELAVKIAGGDESVLKNLPGMVGGC